MSLRERAFQQLDPLGALTGRPVSIAAGVGIPLFAAVMTAANHADVVRPVAALLALVAIGAAGVVLTVASDPLRAPFRRRTQLVVTGLAMLAWALSALSTWGANRFLRDDWGPIAVGLILLALSQYRPPVEIAATGGAAALLMGVVALPQAHMFVTPVQPLLYSVVTMTPVLALSLASAAFGQQLVEALDHWQQRARRAVDAVADVNTGWIARSVQQDRVTILNRDIIPFFSDVLQRDDLTAADRERARGIAAAIRAIMVAEADRTWLDLTVEQTIGAGVPVEDPARLASTMARDQRTCLRALLVALGQNPAFERDDFRITLDGSGRTAHVTLLATLATGEGAARSELAPFIAVLRVVFRDVKVESFPPALALRFSYEHR